MKNIYAYSILFIVLVIASGIIWSNSSKSNYSDDLPIENSSPINSNLKKSYYDSGISISLPPGGGEIHTTEQRTVFNSNYYAYLGQKGVTTLSLEVAKGLATVGGPGRGCSAENMSNKGGGTSKTSVMIDGTPFVYAIEQNSGMNQFHDVDRYVQMLDEKTCRFIEISRRRGNVGAYTDDPMETEEINKNNALFASMLDEIEESAFASIKVGDPLFKTYDEKKLLETSNKILKALETKDYKEFAKYINPNEGLFLNLGPSVFNKPGIAWKYGPEDNFGEQATPKLNFSLSEISNAGNSMEEFFYGNTDGKGDPINGTLKFFLERWIYNRDYMNAPEITINSTSPSGNSINSIVKDVGQRNFVNFHFPVDMNSGINWSSMYLIFDEIDGEYKLRAIVKDNWTI